MHLVLHHTKKGGITATCFILFFDLVPVLFSFALPRQCSRLGVLGVVAWDLVPVDAFFSQHQVHEYDLCGWDGRIATLFICKGLKSSKLILFVLLFCIPQIISNLQRVKWCQEWVHKNKFCKMNLSYIVT